MAVSRWLLLCPVLTGHLEAGDVLSPCCWLSQVGLGGCKCPAGLPWLQGKEQHRPLAVFLINPPLRTGGGEGVLRAMEVCAAIPVLPAGTA